MLHRISSTHLLSLRESASTLVQCMSFLWLLPLPTARTLLSAFLPLCKHSQMFCDRMMVLFRKELYGSDVSKRRLAVYGVCLLLTHTERGVLCDPQQQIEIIVSLKPIFSSHFDVRVEFFEGLQKLLSGSKQNVGYHALDIDAQNLLRELVVSRMQRYLVETGSTSAAGKGKAAALGDSSTLMLRIEPCFEYSQESGTGASKQVRCSESLAHLVKCVASMAGIDQSARAVMKALAAQLSCPTSVSTLMTGQDCPGHTDGKTDAQDGAHQRTPLSLSNRLMVLLPLYEIFIDFCACDRPPSWALPLGSADETDIQGSEMWLDIYSTLSAITTPSTSSDWSFETQNDSLERILVSIELVCSPKGKAVDRNAARTRSLRLSPVICRLVRRFLDLSARQEKFPWTSGYDDQGGDEDMEMPSSSSQARSNTRSSHEKCSNFADVAPRVLHCVLFLYENTKPPLNAPSRRASRTTRSSGTFISAETEVVDKSFAPSFARELVEQFKERSKYFDLGDDFGLDEKSYHRMRDLLLEAIRVCVVSGACSTKEIWDGLHPNEPPSHEPISIQVVEQFCSRLEAEIELGIVPLSTLVAYLDLMQAIQENCTSSGSGISEDSGADWSQVSRDLLSMLCRSCSTAPSQALHRVLTFSINALKPSTAIMLSVQVISQVCANICDDHMIVQEPAEMASSFTLNPLDWEIPDFDTTTGTSAIGVCLRHLCTFFSEPVNLERPLSVVLHTATVVTKAFRTVKKVSAGTRSLMIRLARRILSYSTKMTASLIRLESLQKLVLHAALLFTRQALLGADILCGTLPAECTAAAAQIRHAALKCGFQAKSLISTSRAEAIMSGGVLDVASELENVFMSLQKGGGGAEVVVPEPGETVSKKARRKKRRIRSRNAYVDAALDEEDGSDGYGDLEDFIVCKDGIEY